MINDISNVNDKIMNEMSANMITQKQIRENLSQSQPKDTESTEDSRQLNANNRKLRITDTQSLSSEGQSSLESAIQKMRSLSNKAAAEGAAQAAGSTRTSKSGESIADNAMGPLGNILKPMAELSEPSSLSAFNIQATGSGNNSPDTNMGNEVSDFSRFNAIAQQGAAMLSRDNAVSGQASNAATEATTAASNSQISEAVNAMASRATSELDSAVNRVQSSRATLGATQNRLENASANLSMVYSDTSGAEQRIRDVDMDKEMMSYSKYNILNQQAVAMLSQANQAPQQVLQLLGG